MARVGLLLAVLLLLAAAGSCQTCPNSGQPVRTAVVDGAAATYTGADVDADGVNNFAFTTAAATEGVVYSLQISVSNDIALCPLFPLVFQAGECVCSTPATCDASLAEAAPAVTSGAYSGVQSVFAAANTVEQLYPLMPSTTYYVAFWLISGCGISPSSTLSLSVTTAPILQGEEKALIQDMPFYPSGSNSVEAQAFLSIPTSNVSQTIDGIRVTLAPTGAVPDDDFLDCVYFSDQQAPLEESNWWASFTCNPDYNRNAFSFVVELPGK